MVYRKACKIYFLKLKNSIMMRMAYPFNFLMMVVSVFGQAMLNIIFIKVIYQYVPNISGWNQEQALVVVATYLIIEGLIWTTTAYVAGIRNTVRRGILDYELVKPMDTQFLVSVWRVDPEDAMRVVVASYLLFVGLGSLSFPLIVWAGKILIYLLLIFNGYIIFYSLLIAVNTVYIWAIESGNLTLIFENIIRMAQYPGDIFFHKSARIFFSSVMPIIFLATVPAKMIIFGLDYMLVFYSSLIALISFILSRKLWNYALSHYSSASS